MEKIRLQKWFTDAAVLSRRAAEAEIAAGRVTVNGAVAHVGDKADPETDKVTYNGKEIPYPGADRRATYIMLNKPVGYVTTLSDERGRPTVASLVADVGRRVYPVGRLDMYSEGLLLLTDDGELANRLMHPAHGFTKTYKLRVRGAIGDGEIAALTAPMEIDGYRLRPVGVRLIASGETTRDGTVCSSLYVTLSEGRNRQIRKMCEACGLTVLSLKRVSVGPIRLGDLPTGKWRFLTDAEISELKAED